MVSDNTQPLFVLLIGRQYSFSLLFLLTLLIGAPGAILKVSLLLLNVLC